MPRLDASADHIAGQPDDAGSVGVHQVQSDPLCHVAGKRIRRPSGDDAGELSLAGLFVRFMQRTPGERKHVDIRRSRNSAMPRPSGDQEVRYRRCR